MENRPKLYATAAFLTGILITLGFKDFYPDLELRFWRRHNANKTLAGAGLIEHIDLEDHEKEDGSPDFAPEIRDGIEACVGETPLIKIKSLSEETGCDILAKAEVLVLRYESYACPLCLTIQVVSQWLWGKPQG